MNDPDVPVLEPSQRLKAITQHSCALPLHSGLVCGETLHAWEDKMSKLASAGVRSSDVERLVQLHQHTLRSSSWLQTKESYGRSLELKLDYTLNITLPSEIYTCSRSSIDEVRLFGRNIGIVWPEVQYSSDREKVTIRLLSDDRGVVERVERALELAIQCEPLRDSAILGNFRLPSQWKELGNLARAAASGRHDVCVRVDDKNQSIWLYGGKLARREVLQELQKASQACIASRSQALAVRNPPCGVCFQDLEQANVQFETCGHQFCLGCIQPGVTPLHGVPLKCPVDGCGRPISVSDIIKVAPDVEALVEMAVFDYVAKHPRLCAVCPKLGCNQILSRAYLVGTSCVACESCGGTYCVPCTQATGRAVEQHEGVRCEENQVAGSHVVEHHARAIRDAVLMLGCPACKTAFHDFEGCMSVICGSATCLHHFCGACLTFSDLSATVTHEHVKVCSKNPAVGGLYLSVDALTAIHRTYREHKLNEYLLTQIPSMETRRMVVKCITKDLSDLGLSEPSHLLE